MTFKELGISAPILKVLKEEEYENPTPIQEKTIPDGTKGRDILGLAQTGTGKTAAFAIPVLERLNENRRGGKERKIRALVLTPTRELAIQIQESFRTYGKYLPLKSTVIFGGVKQGGQVQELSAGVDILVATPGRLLDLINQGIVDISTIKIFILDEADRMLDMGFIHDMRKIIKFLPKKKQTMLFSATMPKEIENIAAKLLVDPVEAAVTPVSSTVDMIEQSIYFVDKKNKIEILSDLLRERMHEPVLVFSRTKYGADKIAKALVKRKLGAQSIHGDKSQNARQTALQNFKTGKIRALIATDIAARGIDIHELKYVVNYDLPEVPETYVHRIGRTGRAGLEGEAVSFCSYPEISRLKDIEKLIKKQITVVENEKYPMIDTEEPEKKNVRGGRQEKQLRQPKPERSNQAINTKRSERTEKTISAAKPKRTEKAINVAKSERDNTANAGNNNTSSRANTRNSTAYGRDSRPNRGDSRPNRGDSRPSRGSGRDKRSHSHMENRTSSGLQIRTLKRH